jgi:hypothetical protein
MCVQNGLPGIFIQTDKQTNNKQTNQQTNKQTNQQTNKQSAKVHIPSIFCVDVGDEPLSQRGCALEEVLFF